MQILKKTNQKAYKKALKLGQKGIINLIKKKNLTGRGGGGFPTGLKWEMVLNAPGKEKYVICNADEGEPGTFKDKFILKSNPEAVIEGILIAAYAVGAKQAYIYLRGEYEYLENKLKKVIKDIIKKTKSKTNINIILGQGAYVCGEETAILESIQGKRGHPRIKPPYPTTKGLFGKPTVLNNVETLANIPLAILFDNWNPNLRLYSLSGDVTNPGLYEIPLGTKLCKLIEMGKPKNKIKAIYFGCFGGCMPHCDIPLTPESICGKECMHGAGTIIAVDETRSIVDIATNIAKFFEFESCGKCTPCREGTMRILALLQNISLGNTTKKDLLTLQELAEVIKETSFCGLGQTATVHVLNALKYFRKEFEAKCKSI
ncbi:NADH-quinone oxidoreductase subunit F [Candidatus Woesearchaeota archaeon]|nr:NADH-quinone oxidoreductase subunit F [Candidatus Woesearchaeota archaeon]